MASGSVLGGERRFEKAVRQSLAVREAGPVQFPVVEAGVGRVACDRQRGGGGEHETRRRAGHGGSLPRKAFLPLGQALPVAVGEHRPLLRGRAGPPPRRPDPGGTGRGSRWRTGDAPGRRSQGRAAGRRRSTSRSTSRRGSPGSSRPRDAAGSRRDRAHPAARGRRGRPRPSGRGRSGAWGARRRAPPAPGARTGSRPRSATPARTSRTRGPPRRRSPRRARRGPPAGASGDG